jgi:polar amino acid transport system permease protein
MTVSTEARRRPEGRRRVSPRVRRQRIRVVQYVVLIAAVAAAALLADWDQIAHVFFNLDFAKQTVSDGLWPALLHTITFSAGGFVIGLVAGTLLALMRLSDVAPYRWIATAYVEFFRGLPTLIVFISLSLLPLAFPGFSLPYDPYGTVWLALGIVGSAYMAETIRAGIKAVPAGQVEAARSLGMTSASATRKIVLPQAFRIMIPPLTNELIILIKDSSLVYAIGIAVGSFDLTAFGKSEANNLANVTPLVVAGLAYLVITLPLSWLVRRMEASTARTQ